MIALIHLGFFPFLLVEDWLDYRMFVL